MTNSINQLWAQAFVDELARGGLRDVVISPGSRSTPLVLEFAAHPDIRAHSLIDERAAAFFALGLIRSTLSPVAILSTSGTAAANYLPALCEADLSKLPLLVLTADRPASLHDTGASQAMLQTHLYGSRVRWQHTLELPESRESSFAYLRDTAAKAGRDWRGPIHLNIPFRKPLEPQELPKEHPQSTQGLDLSSAEVCGRADGRPWTEFVAVKQRSDLESLRVAQRLLNHANAPLVVVGSIDWPPPLAAFEALISTGIPVAAETLSGLRSCKLAENVIDLDLLAASLDEYQPDVVLMVGRSPIHWPIQRWLSKLQPTQFIRISDDPLRPNNPDHQPGISLGGDLANLLANLVEPVIPQRGPNPLLDAARKARVQFDLDVAAEPLPLDGRVIWELQKGLRPGDAVVVSSSMPLRDAELFWQPTTKDIAWFANRGLNGIDGVTSMAAGVAAGRLGRTFLVIGDVAFSHDIGALDILAGLDANLTLIVVNNNGGAIFSHLPLAKTTHEPAVFKKHFTTQPKVNVQEVAAAYELTYAICEGWDEFGSKIERADGVTLIEVCTNSDPGQRAKLFPKLPSVPVPPRSYRVDERPIVFIHGFTENRTSWPPEFRRSDRSLIFVDVLGHGSAPHLGTWTMEDCVEHVLRELSAFETFDLVGYSMGGRVALALAALHPERVGKLVTIGATPGIESLAERSKRQQEDNLLADKIVEVGLHQFIADWMKLPLFKASLPEEYLRRSYAQRLRGSSRGLANALRGFGAGAQPSYWHEIDAWRFPCLFIAGAEDTKFSAIAESMASRVVNGQLSLIPDAGHRAHIEQPTRVAKLIQSFLEEP